MSIERRESIKCPNCGADQEVTVWGSLNVDLDPELRVRLFNGEINMFECSQCQKKAFLDVPLMYHDMTREFTVMYYPAQSLDDPEFIGLFEPSNPPKMKNLPMHTGYIGQPHIVFDMNDFLNCIVFHERIREQRLQNSEGEHCDA